MTAFGALFDRVRETSPLVHCISNLVSANDCANIVLAAGASPIMADDPEEVEEITALSRALCLSLGTPTPRKAEAMVKAGRTAARLGLPVQSVDFSRPSLRQETLRFSDTDLVVFGTPVYAGRVPNVLLPFPVQ